MSEREINSLEESILTPLSELRADAAMADEPQQQFYNVDELIANLENYDEWPTDPKKRVIGKKYIKKGKIVECCSGGKGATGAKGTIEQTVIDSNIKHNGKYKFPIQCYWNNSTKIRIHCSECRKYFPQKPARHLRKINPQGCPDCGHKRTANARRMNTEDFIEKAKTAQGDRFDNYDYSAVDYQLNHINVKILCKKCNKYFEQTPNNHLEGKGCPDCGNERAHLAQRFTTEEFIEKAREKQGGDFDNYDYSEVDYQGYDILVKIFCKKCNKYFEQTPHKHLDGCGCQDCGRKKIGLALKSNTEEFIEKAKTAQGDDFDNYDYSEVDYQGKDINVEIFCKKCDKSFPQTPHSHLAGSGCPLCKFKTQKKLFKVLNKLYPDNVEHEKKYDWCKGKRHYRFDYVVNENIIIELDGDQHIDKEVTNWLCLIEQQDRDMYKMTQAINNGKHVIRILQRDVWNDTNNWEEKLIQAITKLKDVTEPTIRCIGNCEVYKQYTIE